MFKGPVLTKKNGNLGGRETSTDKTFGLIMGGVAVADKIAIGDVVELLQVEDAELLGINAAYDANNKILAWYHIDEFFRRCPDAHLFIMLVPRGTTLTEICDSTVDNDPVGPGSLYAMMRNEKTRAEIKKIGVVLNPLDNYVSVPANGLDGDVLTAVPKAQAAIDALYDEFIFLDDILIEGREANGTYANMKDLRTLASESVSVVIGQDPAIAALDAKYAKTAAVGSALGDLAIRMISESLGSVDIVKKPNAKKADENYTLTDAALGRWLTASLSSGVLVSTLTQAEQTVLNNKGYIYAGSYNGYTGVYWNDGHTCTALTNDYCYIERNSTWNKAARYLRSALIPKMKSKYKKDPATGYPTATTIAVWEQAAQKKLDLMVVDDEVSEIGVYIDPKQTPTEQTPLVVKVAIVMDGILREMNIEVGLANKL